MRRLEMKNCKTILTKKQQKYWHYLWRIDKNEYLTGEEILPSDQRRVIAQAKFTYSPLSKALEKKPIEKQRKKVEALEVLKPNTQKLKIKDVIPENTLSEEAKTELNETDEIENIINRRNLVYKANKIFKSFRIIKML